MRAYADTLQAALERHAPRMLAQRFRLATGPVQGRWAGRMESARLLRSAWRARHAEVDIWHVLDGSRAYLSPTFRSRPVVVTAHDVIPCLQATGLFEGAPTVGRAARWLWRANIAAIQGADAVVCDSESTRRDLAALSGLKAGHHPVVALPLRPGLAQHLPDRRSPRGADGRCRGRVLHVGNNGFYKNRAQVLRIFAAIDAALAEELVMLGPPPTGELLRLAEGLGLDARVRWLADPDDAELANMYLGAGLMLFPSRYEGFGWPVLESMAFGLPVLASNGGSLPEVVGRTSACLAAEDVAGFAAAAEHLLRSDSEWTAVSTRGVLRAAEFGEKQFAETMQQVYLDAVERREAASGRT